jgi:hypothetical protein
VPTLADCESCSFNDGIVADVWMIDESEVDFILLAKFQNTAISKKTHSEVILRMFSLLTNYGFAQIWIADYDMRSVLAVVIDRCISTSFVLGH